MNTRTWGCVCAIESYSCLCLSRIILTWFVVSNSCRSYLNFFKVIIVSATQVRDLLLLSVVESA